MNKNLMMDRLQRRDIENRLSQLPDRFACTCVGAVALVSVLVFGLHAFLGI